MNRGGWCAAIFAAVVVAAPEARAGFVYTFRNITNNNATDAGTEGQYKVTVSDAGLSEGKVLVDFKFENAGPAASSITDVYFDDGTLLELWTITNGPGVLYDKGAKPKDLPGGQNLLPPFQATVGFTADSDSPVQINGVNPGEWVVVQFRLFAGKTFQNTIDALNGPLGQGDDLRIGIHVQGFQGGGSESFVNISDYGPNVVPEPGTLTLAACALLGCGVARWRRRRRA